MAHPVAAPMPMTVQEYLAFADARPHQRFQLLEGCPVAMAPATRAHQLISANIDRGLFRQVRGRGCEVLRDFGVSRADDDDFLPQPDVMVRCGPLGHGRRWAPDPIVIVEVLSSSTMADDRGYKLKLYLDLPTLRDVVLVYQDEMRVEHWSRDESGAWSEGPLVLKRPEDRVSFPAVAADLSLSEIYEDVFSP